MGPLHRGGQHTLVLLPVKDARSVAWSVGRFLGVPWFAHRMSLSDSDILKMPRFGRSNWIGLKIPEYMYIYCICVIYTYGWCVLKLEPILKHVNPGWQRNQHVVILPIQFVVRPRKACSVLGIWRGCLKECLSHPSNNHGNGKGGKGHFFLRNSQFSFFFLFAIVSTRPGSCTEVWWFPLQNAIGRLRRSCLVPWLTQLRIL